MYICRFLILTSVALGIASLTVSGQRYSSQQKSTQPVDSVEVYLDSAQRITSLSPLRAVALINKAITWSLEAHSSSGEMRAYKALGDIQQQLGQHDLALNNYAKSLQANQKSFSKVRKDAAEYIIPEEQQAVIHLQIAISQRALGRTAEARQSVAMCLTALDETHSYTAHQARRLDALLINDQKNDKKALQLLNALLIEEKKSGDQKEQCLTLLAAGECEERNGRYSDATSSFNEARLLAERTGDDNLLILCNKALASVYRVQGNTDLEVKVRSQNLQLQEAQSNFRDANMERIEIGNAYLMDDDLIQADNYFKNQSASSTGEIKPQVNRIDPIMPKIIRERSVELQQGADAYKRLAEGFLKRQELEKALEYFTLYAAAQDSVRIAQERELKEALTISANIGKNEQRIQLLEKERELNDQALELLRKDQAIAGEQIVQRNVIIGVLVLFLIAMVITAIVVVRNQLARRKSDKLLALQSLSGQMNPHFIFNALNSVNEYIALRDERQANRYLTDFSRLMRQVLDDSRHTVIPLNDEIAMLRLYLQLEHSRFSDKYDYILEVDDALEGGDAVIPPMLIQPYVENAVWHGLRYRPEKGKLVVRIYRDNDTVNAVIEDNGIGVSESQRLKTANQRRQHSLGMENTKKRIALINEVFHGGITAEVSELHPGAAMPGTRVKITIPQNVNYQPVA
jgi:hypothetical protein